MYFQFRVAAAVVPAIFLLTFLTATGQTVPGTDTATAEANLKDRRVRTRPAQDRSQAIEPAKRPFEQSVIIYYKVPGTRGTASPTSDAAVSSSAAKVQVQQPGNPVGSSNLEDVSPKRISSRSATGGPTVPVLQPVLVFYRAYKPAATVRSSELKLAVADPIMIGPAAAHSGSSSDPDKALRIPMEETLPAKTSPNEVTAAGENTASTDDASSFANNSIPNESRKAEYPSKAIETDSIVIEKPTPVPVGNLIRGSVPGKSLPTAETAAKKVSDDERDGTAVIVPVNEDETASSGIPNFAETSIGVSGSPSSLMTPSAPKATADERPVARTLPAADLSKAKTLYVPVEIAKLNNSAVHLTLDDRFSEAQELLERAIAAQPDIARFHRNLSIVYERMKKYDAALTSARNAAKLAPSDPSVLEQLCPLELSKGSPAEAVGCYEKLIAVEPPDAFLLTNYGTAMFRSGKVDESTPILEKAARSTPPIAGAWNALGVAYYAKKRLAEAVTSFKTAVEIAPDILEIRFNLAVAYLALQNKTAALSQYNMMKQGDPKLADQLYRMLYSDKLLFVGDPKRQ